MSKKATLGLTVLACFAGAGPLLAQRSQPDKCGALCIASPIKLDGVLDEAEWAKAPRISNFTQRELDENTPATERTEVAVLFSRRICISASGASTPSRTRSSPRG